MVVEVALVDAEVDEVRALSQALVAFLMVLRSVGDGGLFIVRFVVGMKVDEVECECVVPTVVVEVVSLPVVCRVPVRVLLLPRFEWLGR
jgi:hypothetical protein